MLENDFTASNICRPTKTSVALLCGQSMVFIVNKKSSSYQLFVREDKSIIKHFIDLKPEINN